MTYGLGIDLGTTYTAAALYRSGRAETVPLGLRANAIPTVVYVGADATVVGEPAEALGSADPVRLVREFKRDIGMEGPYPGTALTLEDLTAAVLRSVVERVTELQRDPPGSVTITCPATWQDHRRDVLAGAARAAGIESAALLTEPEAAAIYYAAEQRLEAGDVIGVFDFGGGTFDATVLRKTPGGFEIVGEPLGDDHLGGIDIDRIVMAHVVDVLGPSWTMLDSADPEVNQARQAVRRSAVEAKELLCTQLEVPINVVLPGMITSVRLTRGELERRIRRLIDRALERFEEAIETAGARPGDLRAALLVGGSSRIPLVAELITGQLGVPVATDTHPKFAVCLGAAIAAGRRQLGNVDLGRTPVEPTTRPPTEPRRPTLLPEIGAEPVGYGLPGRQSPVPDEPVTIPLDDDAMAVDVDLAAQGLTEFLDVPVGAVLPTSRVMPMIAKPAPVLVRTPGHNGSSSRRTALIAGGVTTVVAVAAIGLALTGGSDEPDTSDGGRITAVTVAPVVTTVPPDYPGVRIVLVAAPAESTAAAGALAAAISDSRDADPRPEPPASVASAAEVPDTADAVIVGPGAVMDAVDAERLASAGVVGCSSTSAGVGELPPGWLDLGVSDEVRAGARAALEREGLVVRDVPPADSESFAANEVVLVPGGDDDVVDFMVDTYPDVGDAARVYDCAATVIAAWWSAAGVASAVDLNASGGTPCTPLATCRNDPGSHWNGRGVALIAVGAGDARWSCSDRGCERLD